MDCRAEDSGEQRVVESLDAVVSSDGNDDSQVVLTSEAPSEPYLYMHFPCTSPVVFG